MIQKRIRLNLMGLIQTQFNRYGFSLGFIMRYSFFMSAQEKSSCFCVKIATFFDNIFSSKADLFAKFPASVLSTSCVSLFSNKVYPNMQNGIFCLFLVTLTYFDFADKLVERSVYVNTIVISKIKMGSRSFLKLKIPH